MTCITCHQPRRLRAVSFSSGFVRGVHARASGEAARRAKRGRQSHAWPMICVSRVLLDGLQKKERLLVVYQPRPQGFSLKKSPGDEVDLPSLTYLRGMSIRPLCKLGKNTLKRPNNRVQIFADDVNIGICTHK